MIIVGNWVIQTRAEHAQRIVDQVIAESERIDMHIRALQAERKVGELMAQLKTAEQLMGFGHPQ